MHGSVQSSLLGFGLSKCKRWANELYQAKGFLPSKGNNQQSEETGAEMEKKSAKCTSDNPQGRQEV